MQARASGRAGVAGLFADEPGSSQAEISVRPDQAGRGDGAGRPDLREGVEGARSHRRHRRSRRASLRRHQERVLCRSRGDAGDERRSKQSIAKITPDTVGKLLFTSGSTGMPKAVINTQEMMCANAAMMMQVRPRDPERADLDRARLDAVESHHGRQCRVPSGAGRWRHALYRRRPADAGPDRGDPAKSARDVADLLRQRAGRLRGAGGRDGEGRRAVPQLLQESVHHGLWRRAAAGRSL